MTYATQQDMVDRYSEQEIIELTDRINATAIDVQVLDQALKDADGIINAHLPNHFSVPLSPVPDIIVTYACDLARYYLYDDAAPEQVIKRKEDVFKFLSLVAAGKINLGVDSDTGSSASESNEGAVMFEGGGNVFDRKDNGFI